MSFLILAPEDDNHTAPIKWALEKAGYPVSCWAGLSWKEEGQSSLLADEDDTLLLGNHKIEHGDVVWIRRPEMPVTNPKTDEADLKFATLEYEAFYRSIAYLLQTLPVWCINKYSASRMMQQKAVQLRLARQCGLDIPATLMSNRPASVREFFERKGMRAICKGFTPHVWQKEDVSSIAITETFELHRNELPSDEVLTYAPAIYQAMVVKDFDVRTVLMGQHVYSYAITNSKKALDWRQDATLGYVGAEPVQTPHEVERDILEFAYRSGLCFGSMDFCVDAERRWWFLEINEQGQFLWLDQFNRDIRLLEKFCAFVTAPEGSTAALEDRQDLFPSLKEYEDLLARGEITLAAQTHPKDPCLSIEA